jgi:hypothetical protein
MRHSKTSAFQWQYHAASYCAILMIGIIFFNLLFESPHPTGIAGRPRDQVTRVIFDCFLYHSESYMLYLHLLTLAGHVDKFVIGYSNESFATRNVSSVSYAPFEKEIMSFKKSIHFLHIDFTILPLSQSKYRNETSWQREATARNHLIDGVRHFNPAATDLVLLCDVDEIVTREAIEMVREQPPQHYYNLHGLLFHYSFRWMVGEWDRPMVIRYGSIEAPLDDYKFYPFLTILPGVLHYHCSFCFPTMAGILKKLASFSHTEYSGGKFGEPAYVYARIACGFGVIPKRWAMPEVLTPVDFNADAIYLPEDPRLEFFRYRIGFTDLDRHNLTVRKVKEFVPKKCRTEFGKNLYKIVKLA